MLSALMCLAAADDHDLDERHRTCNRSHAIQDCLSPSACECGAQVRAQSHPVRHQGFDISAVKADVQECVFGLLWGIDCQLDSVSVQVENHGGCRQAPVRIA